jgi:hypothetical protein
MLQTLLALGRLHLNGADTPLRKLKDHGARVPRLDGMDKFEQLGIAQRALLLQDTDQANHRRRTQAHECLMQQKSPRDVYRKDRRRGPKETRVTEVPTMVASVTRRRECKPK